MGVLLRSATFPVAVRQQRRLQKPKKRYNFHTHSILVTASLHDGPSSEGRDEPHLTLSNKLPYVAILAAIATITPACLPVVNIGGGGGNGFLNGFGGGGGGGFGPFIPVAHADPSDSDDDDSTDSSEEEDSNDDDAAAADDDDDDDEEDDEDGDDDEVQVLRASGQEDVDVSDDFMDEESLVKELEKYGTPPEGMEKSSFYVNEVVAEGLPQGKNIPTATELFASLNCQPGFWVSKQRLDDDLEDLRDMGIFKEVIVKVVPLSKSSKSKRMRAIFKFSETVYPPVKSFKILNSKVLPPDMANKVMTALKKGNHEGKPTGLDALSVMRSTIEEWYSNRGFAYCTMSNFDGLDTGDVTVTVSEPKIRNVIVKYVDENMEEKEDGGNTPVDLVTRTVSLRPGQYYTQFDGRKALQEAFTLQVFENAQVIPEFPDEAPDMLDVVLLLKERAVKTMDLDMEWALAPAIPRIPLPLPMTLVPGGSLTYEDRNFSDTGDQVSASLMCSNFLHPTDDLSARLQYRRPFVFGKEADEDLVCDAFNARRLSSVFAGSPGIDVTPVWVERAGVKAGLARHLTRHSNSHLAVVTQQIKTRDDTNSLVTHGSPGGQRGEMSEGGPPTSLSGTGIDRTITLQGTVMRDTTFLVNGAIVGSRDIGEVDQGVGIGNGFANRYTVSSTRFVKLNTPNPSSFRMPFVLALHARHGNCIGPIASYDYPVLGGPHSCRGYSLGELGPARNFLEASVELRAPVPLMRTQAYVFADHARDLGTADDLVGKPRECYNKSGRGSSYGAGIKLGIMRFEWAQDCNVGKGAFFMNFGERY